MKTPPSFGGVFAVLWTGIAFKFGFIGLKPFSKTLPFGEGGPRSGG